MLQERILAYGSPGSGKSYNWLKLAESLPNVQFRVIDTDKAIEWMLNEEFSHLSNVEVYDALDWNSCKTALEKIKPKIKPASTISKLDWVVVDFVDSTWDFIQNWYVESVFKEDVGDYFLAVRRAFAEAGKSPSAEELGRALLEGWTDWRVINKNYQPWINTICYQLPANVYLASQGVKLQKTDEQYVKDLFSSYGLKPEGEKRMPRRVHTLLLLEHDRENWYATTPKTRRKKKWEHVRITNFGMQYLVGMAGWGL